MKENLHYNPAEIAQKFVEGYRKINLPAYKQ